MPVHDEERGAARSWRSLDRRLLRAAPPDPRRCRPRAEHVTVPLTSSVANPAGAAPAFRSGFSHETARRRLHRRLVKDDRFTDTRMPSLDGSPREVCNQNNPRAQPRYRPIPAPGFVDAARPACAGLGGDLRMGLTPSAMSTADPGDGAPTLVRAFRPEPVPARARSLDEERRTRHWTRRAPPAEVSRARGRPAFAAGASRSTIRARRDRLARPAGAARRQLRCCPKAAP